MKLSDAVQGYYIDKQAAGYSVHTIRLYQVLLPIFVRFLGDPPIESVTLDDLNRFMIHLRTDYRPNRINGSQEPLSQSHLCNFWKAIRSLFKFCNLVLDIPRPDLRWAKPDVPDKIMPAFTEDEIRRLMKACEYSAEVKPGNRRSFHMRRPTALRDKALLLIMLDTGMRIGEINRCRINDVSLEKGEIVIQPFGSGAKSRSRTVILGRLSKRALWQYMTKLEDMRPSDRLFYWDMDSIRSFLRRLGERADVPDVHPHKFRHTFAIMYLRNGGDVFSLKRLLGHHSLKMVERYLDIARSDVENAHRIASPVDNWKL